MWRGRRFRLPIENELSEKKIENEESSVLHRSDDGYDWVQQSVGQACA